MPNSVRPNLLYIFADQMRGMDMHCVGNTQLHTPNLDRLAEQGMRLTHAYANTPVCTASRAMLLTGLYPANNRVVANDLPLPVELPSLGHIFHSAGYRTGYIGKWHLDGVPRNKWTPPGPRRHGFEHWAAYNCSHDYFRADKYYRDLPVAIRMEGYEPEVQTNLALDFLATTDERPFCLLLSWGPPHDPYPLVPEVFKDQYDPATIYLRPNVSAVHPDAAPLARDWETRETIANYYAAISALDLQLGRILDFLDETGLVENTIVVFTSDHGDMLWSHGRMKKQLPWEESINIPFLIRWPGQIQAGAVSDALFGVIDHLPTLLSLCGVEASARLQGVDLAPTLRGEAQTAPSSLFLMDMVRMDESHAQNMDEWRGLRTERYTYARWLDGRPWLLYDNENDPYQLINLVDDRDYAHVQRELDIELEAQIAVTGDICAPGPELLRRLDLVDLWNEREQLQHPQNPQVVT
ncbi:MAG: sulfatase [Caldilineaceae bacterium]|nr:sulfatase [Caldilineaceae bacterium]